ncbi:hypothetical protein EOI86_21410 [Hwanghaeella grinnelliae]|uniref:Secreted protein n=1 Tax=Hwanghaeella grinnelliae TaxID=2500179 RepID=A0A437QGL8_9PROT|nr:hypothetical protein [Hwanghaeella grinnelliae]RVU33708.1 hypothetical protein EOI86_21410 [Hwanghaeella grinnelliae]
MKNNIRFAALAALLVFALPFASQAAEDIKAKPWNLAGEELARFDAKVVDIVCELSGDCPADCGGGSRQLGLIAGNGDLLLAGKNSQAIFTGAVVDLLPHCGTTVTVDGLFTGIDGGPKLFQVQFIRPQGAGEDIKANAWGKTWNANHPDLKDKKGPWFRKDPRVNALIERDGYLGLSHAADKEFLEWFE